MAYQVPKLDKSSSAPRIVVPVLRGRGRPKIYHSDTTVVNFRVPKPWQEEGSEKARQGKINLTKLFSIYYREFLDRPTEETQAFIDEWEEKNGSITEAYP